MWALRPALQDLASLQFYLSIGGTSGFRGPWRPKPQLPPSPRSFFLNSCSLHAIWKENPYFEQILGSGSPWVKTPLDPLPLDQSLGSTTGWGEKPNTTGLSCFRSRFDWSDMKFHILVVIPKENHEQTKRLFLQHNMCSPFCTTANFAEETSTGLASSMVQWVQGELRGTCVCECNGKFNVLFGIAGTSSLSFPLHSPPGSVNSKAGWGRQIAWCSMHRNLLHHWRYVAEKGKSLCYWPVLFFSFCIWTAIVVESQNVFADEKLYFWTIAVSCGLILLKITMTSQRCAPGECQPSRLTLWQRNAKDSGIFWHKNLYTTLQLMIASQETGSLDSQQPKGYRRLLLNRKTLYQAGRLTQEIFYMWFP